MTEFIKPATHNISRRRFMKGGIVAFVLLCIAVLLFDFRTTVRRILKRDTRHLNLQPGVIKRFISDANKENYWNQFGLAKRVLICLQDGLLMIGIHTPYYGKYLRYRNEIVGKFLFSTDLFNGRYDEGKAITYQGFHNLYKSPCGNPFSNLRVS
jgi:hypothetical protein